MYAALLLNGFVPDTMLVHPMAWLMWVKDPVIREFAIQAGGGSFFAQFTGNPAVQGNPFYNFGGLGLGQGQTGQYTGGALTGGEVQDPAAGNYQRMQSAPIIPNYLGLPFIRIRLGPFPSGAQKLRPRAPDPRCILPTLIESSTGPPRVVPKIGMGATLLQVPPSPVQQTPPTHRRPQLPTAAFHGSTLQMEIVSPVLK